MVGVIHDKRATAAESGVAVAGRRRSVVRLLQVIRRLGAGHSPY
jgi:hypothetical protein